MINYTKRLDNAVRIAAIAHEKQGQHRKGSDIPYVIHPFGVMLIASNATADEDTLIGCLLHDVLEDVSPEIYDEKQMAEDFGANVLNIVKDVSKNDFITGWHERSRAYLDHIENNACNEAVTVCTADKIHNIQSVIIDYETKGEELWNIFATKNSQDQIWWYESVLSVVIKRETPNILSQQLANKISELKQMIS